MINKYRLQMFCFCYIAFLFAIVAIAGCEGRIEGKIESKVISEAEKDEAFRIDLRLPPNAKNIVTLNDEWHTFDLNLNGSNRSFLRRSSNPGYDSAVDTFTELNPK